MEARQQIPIISQNTYAPLSNAADFPTVQESFASMTKGSYGWKDPLREQWIKTNQERKTIEAAVKTYKEQPKNTQQQNRNKRSRQESSDSRTGFPTTADKRNIIIGHGVTKKSDGTALNNPHSVTEKERWQTMLKEAQEITFRTLQETMMTFYTDFIGMLGAQEDVKDMFKQCTKKHFNLANTVVLNKNQAGNPPQAFK